MDRIVACLRIVIINLRCQQEAHLSVFFLIHANRAIGMEKKMSWIQWGLESEYNKERGGRGSWGCEQRDDNDDWSCNLK